MTTSNENGEPYQNFHIPKQLDLDKKIEELLAAPIVPPVSHQGARTLPSPDRIENPKITQLMSYEESFVALVKKGYHRHLFPAEIFNILSSIPSGYEEIAADMLSGGPEWTGAYMRKIRGFINLQHLPSGSIVTFRCDRRHGDKLYSRDLPDELVDTLWYDTTWARKNNLYIETELSDIWYPLARCKYNLDATIEHCCSRGVKA